MCRDPLLSTYAWTDRVRRSKGYNHSIHGHSWPCDQTAVLPWPKYQTYLSSCVSVWILLRAIVSCFYCIFAVFSNKSICRNILAFHKTSEHKKGANKTIHEKLFYSLAKIIISSQEKISLGYRFQEVSFLFSNCLRGSLFCRTQKEAHFCPCLLCRGQPPAIGRIRQDVTKRAADGSVYFCNMLLIRFLNLILDHHPR